MNPIYQKLAYERTIVATLRRHLEETYLNDGGASKEELICEEVPFAMREVPNESFIEAIQKLQEEERVLTEEMSSYDHRKRDGRAARRGPEEPTSGRPRKPRRKGRAARAKPAGTGQDQ